MGLFKKARKGSVGLALGGGAVLGAAHIGVLKALEEKEVDIRYIAGTSIGAFVGAFYAFGNNWVEIEAIAKDLNWLDISGISIPKLGLLSNQKMGELIREKIGDVSLDDATIPFAAVTTDITSGEKVVLREGNLATAVMASTCIPGVFIPVETDDRLLVDGGLVENVPITPLKEMGADFIIAVDLNGKRQPRGQKPENIVEVLLRTFDIMIQSATKHQTEKADILIQPNLSQFNLVEISQVDDLLEVGYSAARTALQKNL
ncbi:MAG TPA: patatin [Candidatus Marinimicrobia bacterium]|nr:patatin [Candidatus Neomarinimicrobiota bacterium]